MWSRCRSTRATRPQPGTELPHSGMLLDAGALGDERNGAGLSAAMAAAAFVLSSTMSQRLSMRAKRMEIVRSWRHYDAGHRCAKFALNVLAPVALFGLTPTGDAALFRTAVVWFYTVAAGEFGGGILTLAYGAAGEYGRERRGAIKRAARLSIAALAAAGLLLRPPESPHAGLTNLALAAIAISRAASRSATVAREPRAEAARLITSLGEQSASGLTEVFAVLALLLAAWGALALRVGVDAATQPGLGLDDWRTFASALPIAALFWLLPSEYMLHALPVEVWDGPRSLPSGVAPLGTRLCTCSLTRFLLWRGVELARETGARIRALPDVGHMLLITHLFGMALGAGVSSGMVVLHVLLGVPLSAVLLVAIPTTLSVVAGKYSARYLERKNWLYPKVMLVLGASLLILLGLYLVVGYRGPDGQGDIFDPGGWLPPVIAACCIAGLAKGHIDTVTHLCLTAMVPVTEQPAFWLYFELSLSAVSGCCPLLLAFFVGAFDLRGEEARMAVASILLVSVVAALPVILLIDPERGIATRVAIEDAESRLRESGLAGAAAAGGMQQQQQGGAGRKPDTVVEWNFASVPGGGPFINPSQLQRQPPPNSAMGALGQSVGYHSTGAAPSASQQRDAEMGLELAASAAAAAASHSPLGSATRSSPLGGGRPRDAAGDDYAGNTFGRMPDNAPAFRPQQGVVIEVAPHLARTSAKGKKLVIDPSRRKDKELELQQQFAQQQQHLQVTGAALQHGGGGGGGGGDDDGGDAAVGGGGWQAMDNGGMASAFPFAGAADQRGALAAANFAEPPNEEHPDGSRPPTREPGVRPPTGGSRPQSATTAASEGMFASGWLAAGSRPGSQSQHSRPGSRGSASRPGSGARPNSAARPTSGVRPNSGVRPSSGVRARPNSGVRPSSGVRPGSGGGTRARPASREDNIPFLFMNRQNSISELPSWAAGKERPASSEVVVNAFPNRGPGEVDRYRDPTPAPGRQRAESLGTREAAYFSPSKGSPFEASRQIASHLDSARGAYPGPPLTVTTDQASRGRSAEGVFAGRRGSGGGWVRPPELALGAQPFSHLNSARLETIESPRRRTLSTAKDEMLEAVRDRLETTGTVDDWFSPPLSEGDSDDAKSPLSGSGRKRPSGPGVDDVSSAILSTTGVLKGVEQALIEGAKAVPTPGPTVVAQRSALHGQAPTAEEIADKLEESFTIEDADNFSRRAQPLSPDGPEAPESDDDAYSPETMLQRRMGLGLSTKERFNPKSQKVVKQADVGEFGFSPPGTPTPSEAAVRRQVADAGLDRKRPPPLVRGNSLRSANDSPRSLGAELAVDAVREAAICSPLKDVPGSTDQGFTWESSTREAALVGLEGTSSPRLSSGASSRRTSIAL